MKLIVALAVLVAVCSASVEHSLSLGSGSAEALFQEWIIAHGVNYNSLSETQDKFEVFKSNLAIIDELNASNPDAHFTTTKFADLTPAEFADSFLAHFPEEYDGEVTEVSSDQRGNEMLYSAHGKISAPANDLPDNFDWQEEGFVARVKNQASCGSCWAFSVAATLESSLAIAQGDITELSEQIIMTCSQYQACACNGGWPINAIESVVDSEGVIAEDAAPYQIPPFGDCHPCMESDWQKSNCPSTPNCNCYCEAEAHSDDVVGSFSGVKSWPEDDEVALQQGLFEHSAISVCISVGQWAQFYDSGVAAPNNCDYDVDHAVLLTGWGTTHEGVDYWRIKNSWGPSWGEDGYFRLVRDGSNRCRISNYAVAGVVDA